MKYGHYQVYEDQEEYMYVTWTEFPLPSYLHWFFRDARTKEEFCSLKISQDDAGYKSKKVEDEGSMEENKESFGYVYSCFRETLLRLSKENGRMNAWRVITQTCPFALRKECWGQRVAMLNRTFRIWRLRLSSWMKWQQTTEEQRTAEELMHAQGKGVTVLWHWNAFG